MTDFVISTLIVEDDKAVSLELSRIVQEAGALVVGIAKSSSEALRYLEKENPDLIILDVNIKGNKNGISMALEIADLNIPILLLLNEHRKYDLELISSIKHFAFLRRPIDSASIKTSVAELFDIQTVTHHRDRIPYSKNSLIYKKRGKHHRVSISDILYIKAADDYTITVTSGGEFVSSLRLFHMEEKLNQFGFFKSHRSYLVNPEKVVSVGAKKTHILIGEDQVPISRNSKLKIVELCNSIFEKRNSNL